MSGGRWKETWKFRLHLRKTGTKGEEKGRLWRVWAGVCSCIVSSASPACDSEHYVSACQQEDVLKRKNVKGIKRWWTFQTQALILNEWSMMETQNFWSLFLAFPPCSLWLVHGTVSECTHGFFNKENPFYPKWRDDDFLWKSVRGTAWNTLEERGSLSGHYSHAFAVSFL